jgi:glycogen operon protein
MLLIDPYARAISGPITWSAALCAYRAGDPLEDLSLNSADSAPHVPRCVVVETAFSWGDDRPPRTPWNRTVIYECHVKGMTARHPGVPEHLRGTFLGLSMDPIIEHLLALGVTAIELMPVHHFVHDRHVVERGLRNYWGYNSIGFFAPHVEYATSGFGRQVTEFKTMVKRFHGAGIEVILDVVYNHTGEGDYLGPTLSLRGIDNASYYRLLPENRSAYIDFTGCGNGLNMQHPRSLQLIMDSLRYWVTDMHVDGFRFDLAPALARELYEVDRLGSFFDIIQQDPILSQAKLIAEPWDLGPGGYQVGNFPAGWAEWNGKYRDAVRRFWRGDPELVPELASRISGSSDLYGWSSRSPHASINFVTCHDGYTLADLVSYEHKHNDPNREDNRDGADANWSRNWGAEGPTDSASIRRLRDRIKRNFLATLAFSQGVPMLSHGDEMGRTQRGNNNAYCQDNEASWVSWDLGDDEQALLDFTRRLFGALRDNPVLRRRSFFSGRPVSPGGHKDVAWLRADGREMAERDWVAADRHFLGMLLYGGATDEVDSGGRPLTGDTLLLYLNAGARTVACTLPTMPTSGEWHEVVDTAQDGGPVVKGHGLKLAAHSLVLLRFPDGGAGQAEWKTATRARLARALGP